MKAETAKLGIPYINTTPLSRLAANNTSLVAADGLHYSASMYKLWVDKLVPVINHYYIP